MRALNEDRTRMVSDEDALFAIAGYVGEVTDGQFVGRHAGCFQTAEKAEAWLRGEGEPDFKLQYSVA